MLRFKLLISFLLGVITIVYISNSYTIPHKVDGLRCCNEVDPIEKVFSLKTLFLHDLDLI